MLRKHLSFKCTDTFVYCFTGAFGGQMGMLMGASLLSFFEFLEFLIQLIMIKITRKRAIKLNKKVTK